MTEIHNLSVDAISCHAWNRDKTEIAICPNNNEIQVHKRTSSGWKLLETLEEHHMAVMGIDWAPKTNRIVTCSADKNAYVWTQKEDGKWDPAWVLLRINRAATCVKWSPLENKFAVGSGGRVIAVCYFVSENNWWLCKHIKRPLRSTVTTVDWHPDNKVLVAGSTDYKVRVFSAFISDMEDAPGTSPWGQSNTLGTLLAEFPNTPNGGGWIHSVAFSPCGNKICWVAHNSSICVADATKGNAVIRLYTEHLPFLSCIWIGSNTIVAAGHSCMPMLYSVDDNGQIYFVSKLDNTQKKEIAGLSAMRKFQSLDRQARNETNDNALDSVHQNTINCVRRVSDHEFSTSSLDGQLVVWDLKLLENSIAGLKIAKLSFTLCAGRGTWVKHPITQSPRIVSLSLSDCINVADEAVGAVAQLLPSLYEFSLQAYHVTDAALGYFSAKQSSALSILKLQSCWELTNHGVVNIVHSLPNLTVLSLSGCSKVTDDGVELIAENLPRLRSLDLSWCSRITDAALEYIACDLNNLEELTLDRCVHITDIGVGYISTMVSLNALFLRWCSQLRDFGLQHLCVMRSLQVLSVAGCPLLTSSGLSSLIQLRHLHELELTNCPGTSRELFDYLREHLPRCLIIE